MAAAPPPGRRCPCTACSSRESPRGAPRQEQQAKSGCPIGKVLPQSQRRAGKDSGSYAQCRRPSQCPRRGYHFDVLTAPPLALAAPAPHPRTTAARQQQGRFRSVVSCGPATMQAGHALTQRPRRCPRSMTPVAAAAPAPGCWLRCLRTVRFGNAAGQLLLPEAAKGYGTKPEAAQCPALILRITWLRLCAIAQQLPGARALA